MHLAGHHKTSARNDKMGGVQSTTGRDAGPISDLPGLRPAMMWLMTNIEAIVLLAGMVALAAAVTWP